MKTSLLSCVFAMCCAGCVTTAPVAYDPQKDVSPVKVSKIYQPAPLDEAKVPADSTLAMAGIVQMIRGEAAQVDGLSVAPGLKITEPGVPLENFSLVSLTILDRLETETVKGKEWETKTMAVLAFALGPFRALVLTEAKTTASANGVVLEKASVRSLSPAQPRVAAWFVPKKEFQNAIASDKSIAIWDVLDIASSMGVPVGAGLAPEKDRYMAVAFVLDRLETGDSVKGLVNASLIAESSFWGAIPANMGVGFPVVMADISGPLNVPAEEKYLHVMWRPSDSTRTGGVAMDVPIGRFSTCGTVLKTLAPAAAAKPTPRAAADSARLLDLKVKDDAKAIQRQLAQLGFYSGAADGAFGNASRAALAKFKAAKGMGNNSTWDLATQQALFSASEQ